MWFENSVGVCMLDTRSSRLKAICFYCPLVLFATLILTNELDRREPLHKTCVPFHRCAAVRWLQSLLKNRFLITVYVTLLRNLQTTVISHEMSRIYERRWQSFRMDFRCIHLGVLLRTFVVKSLQLEWNQTNPVKIHRMHSMILAIKLFSYTEIKAAQLHILASEIAIKRTLRWTSRET